MTVTNQQYSFFIFLRKWSLLALFVLIWSCSNTSDSSNSNALANQNPKYFDVAGFMQTQVNQLNQRKPAATKTVIENGKAVETKTISSLNWQKELESFIELDINKPALRNFYNITQETEDNHKTEIYQKKPGMDGNVQLLIITRNQQNQVKSLQAVQEQNNVLIKSRRELNLVCDIYQNTPRIRSYEIKGSQKPIFFNVLSYLISTEIK